MRHRFLWAAAALLLLPGIASAFPVSTTLKIQTPIPGQVGGVGYLDATFSQSAAQALVNEVSLSITSHLNAGLFVNGSQKVLALFFNYLGNPGDQTKLDALTITQTSSDPPHATIVKGPVDTMKADGTGGFFDFGFYWGEQVLEAGESVSFKLASTSALAVSDFVYGSAIRENLKRPVTGSTDFLAVAHVQGMDKDVYGAPSTYIAAVAVPEPSALAIAGLGALGFLGYGIRRRNRA